MKSNVFSIMLYIRSSMLLLSCRLGVQLHVKSQNSGTRPLFSFVFLARAGLSFSVSLYLEDPW